MEKKSTDATSCEEQLTTLDTEFIVATRSSSQKRNNYNSEAELEALLNYLRQRRELIEKVCKDRKRQNHLKNRRARRKNNDDTILIRIQTLIAVIVIMYQILEKTQLTMLFGLLMSKSKLLANDFNIYYGR